MTRPTPRPVCSHAMRWRTGAPGYTAIEVLMALTLMSIGAAAVMSMQKASVQGNLDARRGDVAYSIVQMWVERLRKDAMAWTLPSPASAGGSNFANTRFLNNVTGNWFLPNALVAATPPVSPAFDILGRDLADVTKAQFCVHVRLTYLVQDTANPQNNLIRADVRVLWARSMSDPSATIGAGVCDSTVATAPAPDPLKYQSIYVTTPIRQNGVP